MRRSAPRPVGEVLVSYSAEQMPTATLEELQNQTLEEYRGGNMAVADALRITNLLLNIALQKLQALA
jgi:hypothetical protein